MNEIQIAILTLGSIGLVFSVLLAFLSKKLKVQEDPRVEKIVNILPGVNCGACGFSGCKVFAEAVAKECSLFSGCLPGGTEVNNSIAQTLGITANTETSNRVVVCRCGAERDEKMISLLYQGPQTCLAADITGGAIDCVYGCIGFGDCLEVCPVGALSLKGRKIYVDIDKCIGCGHCVEKCPRDLFELVPRNSSFGIYYVACRNNDNAVLVKRVCARGCIGCGICMRVPNSPYYLKEKLSSLDYNKATQKTPLEEARIKCPTKCIFIA